MPDYVTPLTRNQQIALFKAMTARRNNRLPPFIKAIEKEEDNCTFFISFTEEISPDQADKIVCAIKDDHWDYVCHAQWTKTNKLMIRLRKPRRDHEPDSRRAARCDIVTIASEIFQRCR